MAGTAHPFLRCILISMKRSIESGRCAGRERPKGWLRGRGRQLCVLACCAVLVVTAAAGLLHLDVLGHAQSAPVAAPAAPEKTTSSPASITFQLPTPPAGNTADDARKQEITSECADLLKMAMDLKQEVDKSTVNTLSVPVVRKAGEIEQLAHKVRTGSPKG